MPNRLAGEKSPYLLQHADNPVDWYPWGEEAFSQAAAADKPIFLSIGYSTCHWCHVMAHESFEDPEVASLLNRHFISIKVDREERPDVDQIYMTVCQATTGAGGWPLSIFMGPDRKPFFAGSYFPKKGMAGMPGFTDIVTQLAQLWENSRGRLDMMSEEITRAIQPKPAEGEGEMPGKALLERAYRLLLGSFDSVLGGFGSAPKFPTPHNLNFLLRWYRRNPGSRAVDVVERTLDAMRAGGIFDQVGFGFHRYSVDAKWLVPHFEKMLYDQALLGLAYTDAFLATGAARHARVVREIFEYVLREMKSPEGGFYSAEDADSEGQEGVFYTWTPGEVVEILGKEAGEVFSRFFGITAAGNFEDGRSIPHISGPAVEAAGELGMSPAKLEALIEESRQKLFASRERRVHPFKDDKILVAWNGLMIASLARGSQALKDSAYALAAKEAADFILDRMRPEGRLHRRYRHGETANPGYADDYAFLIWGLLELYETVFDTRYLAEAADLQERMDTLFADEAEGGFFYSGADGEKMIVREKVIYDGATPSCNSVSALNLLRLARMTGNPDWETQADRLMRRFAAQVALFPPGYTQFLQAVDFAVGPAREIVIAGEPSTAHTREMIESVHSAFFPNRVLLLKTKDSAAELAELAPYTEPIQPPETGAAAYVCENFSCRSPLFDAAALKSSMLQ